MRRWSRSSRNVRREDLHIYDVSKHRISDSDERSGLLKALLEVVRESGGKVELFLDPELDIIGNEAVNSPLFSMIAALPREVVPRWPKTGLNLTVTDDRQFEVFVRCAYESPEAWIEVDGLRIFDEVDAGEPATIRLPHEMQQRWLVRPEVARLRLTAEGPSS